MTGKIYLDVRESQKRKIGFPLRALIHNKNKQYSVFMGLCFDKKDWDFENDLPRSDKRKVIYVKEKRLLLEKLLFDSLSDRSITVDFIKRRLRNDSSETGVDVSFYSFSNEIIDKLKQKVDSKGVEKKSNVLVYINAINQLKLYRAEFSFQELDYLFLIGFKEWQEQKGNRKSTINTYFRIYRAIYNEASRQLKFVNKFPFKDVMRQVSVKPNRNKKRNVSKNVIEILENISGYAPGQQLAIDLWLLQFYFGGQDFKDLYFLENNQIYNDRVYFVRGKLNEGGYQFDLKLFPKIKLLLDKYKVKGRFVFPWRKDYDGYSTFLRRFQRNLIKVQERYNISQMELPEKERRFIEVMPLGGNLSPKVARHTFATLGRRMYVDPDLLRALMGHERDGVDTIYKDVFKEEDRDYFHLKIIET